MDDDVLSSPVPEDSVVDEPGDGDGEGLGFGAVSVVIPPGDSVADEPGDGDGEGLGFVVAPGVSQLDPVHPL